MDAKLYLGFEILNRVLFDAPGAPVKKALMDAQIGKDIQSSYDNGIMQPVFSVIAQEARDDQEDEFVKILEKNLAKIAKEGIPRRNLLAAFNYYEFKYREANFGRFPKGLMYGLQMYDSWLYDDEKPFIHIKTNEIFKQLREEIENGYFENLIKEYLIDNNHKTIVVMKPKKGLQKIKDQEEADKLKAYKDSLSEEEVKKLVEETKQLKASQEEASTKEELEKVGDICLKHNVLVVSDEIHADFVFKGKHQVFAAIKKEYDQIQKELPKLHKKELRFQELQKQIKQYKELEALEKKKESLKNAKERMIRQQEETEQKKENERQRELKLLEFLRQADEIETQYDHLQKEELKLHVQTEKNHELCKEKEAYFEKLRIYEEAGEVYDKIRMQRKEYRDRLSDWQDRYDCNQAGLLARNLIDGHPCPVCGSLHHPKTADFKESDITQEMLRALREETELIDQQYNTAFAKVKQSKGIVETCKEQLCKKSGKRSEEFEKLDEIYEISLRQYKKVKKEFERIKKQKEKIAEQKC